MCDKTQFYLKISARNIMICGEMHLYLSYATCQKNDQNILHFEHLDQKGYEQ